MAPKQRQGSKAESCCNKCCEAVCRMSPWNQLICWCMIALCAVGTLLLIGGGFAVVPDAAMSNTMCGTGDVNGTKVEDPTVPLLRVNAYGWYLASTGVVVIVMIVFNCLCCASFVGLCCGLSLNNCCKVFLVTGFILFTLMLLIYMVWVGGGTYLMIMMTPSALLSDVCRGLVVYVLLLYMYLVVLLSVMILTVVWVIHGKSKSANFSKLQTVEKGKLRK